METLLRLVKTLSYKSKIFIIQQWKGALVGSAVSWLIFVALGGVIEYYAVKIWNENIYPWLLKQAQINNLILLLLGLTLFVSLLYLIRIRQSKDIYDGIRISTISSIMMRLRDKDITKYQILMDNINKLIQENLSETTEEQLNSLTEDIYQTIFKTLGPAIIDGAGILLPDGKDPNWLYFWSMNASQKRSQKKFFIGPDGLVSVDNVRGIAGHVYREQKPDIVNIHDRSTGESDNPKYHIFDMSRLGPARFNIPYDSFICLPIHWKNRIVGVLSIESQKQRMFDEESKTNLQPVADQIGTILYLFGKIE